MAAYATPDDVEAQVIGWETLSDPVEARYLEAASRDIDRALGAYPYLDDSGLKLGDLVGGDNPRALYPWQIAAVRRATAEQMVYRALVVKARADASAGTGGSVAIPAGAKSISGPHFSIVMADDAVRSTAASSVDTSFEMAPQAMAELRTSGLIRRTAIPV